MKFLVSSFMGFFFLIHFTTPAMDSSSRKRLKESTECPDYYESHIKVPSSDWSTQKQKVINFSDTFPNKKSAEYAYAQAILKKSDTSSEKKYVDMLSCWFFNLPKTDESCTKASLPRIYYRKQIPSKIEHFKNHHPPFFRWLCQEDNQKTYIAPAPVVKTYTFTPSSKSKSDIAEFKDLSPSLPDSEQLSIYPLPFVDHPSCYAPYFIAEPDYAVRENIFLEAAQESAATIMQRLEERATGF